MSLKSQIKTQMILFTVFLCGFVATFLYLFQKNYQQFNVEILSRSHENLEIIESLTKIDTNLYIHKKALLRYVNSGNKKWLVHLNEAEKGIQKQFDSLEEYNKSHFKLWVPVDNFYITNARTELEKQISEFQKGQAEDSGFQRLFYLTRLNIAQYFDLAQSNIKKFQFQKEGSPESLDPESKLKQDILISLDDEETVVKLIYAGINQLVTSYNKMFWDYAQGQNSDYHHNSNYYFLFLAASSALLLLFAVNLLKRVFRFFYLYQLNQDNLVLLGTKDAATGLYNRQSFESLGIQEIERAKRRGYHLSLLVFRLDPFDKMKEDLGKPALDRVLFQFAEVIRRTLRVYDGLFRYDDNVFLALLSETDFTAVNSVVARFQKQFQKTKFPIKKKLAIVPQVHVGFAVYPMDSDKLEDLYQHALNNLTLQFDAHKVQRAVQTNHAPDFNDERLLISTPKPVDRTDLEHQNQTALNAMFEATPAVAVDSLSNHEEQPEITTESKGREPELASEPLSQSQPIREESPQAEVEIEQSPVAKPKSIDSATLMDMIAAENMGSAESEPEQVVSELTVQNETEELPQSQSTQSISKTLDIESEPVSEPEPEPEVEEVSELSTKIAFDEIEEAGSQNMVDEDVPDVFAALHQEELVNPSKPINSNISRKDLDDVNVMSSQQKEDVITVDFDRPQEDVALAFRKKQRERRRIP